MNNNTLLISRYLENEMQEVERSAFEEQLADDKDLQAEMDIQKLIMEVATAAGAKVHFVQALQKRAKLRRLGKWFIVGIVILALWLMYVFYKTTLTHQYFKVETNDRGEHFALNNALDTIIETKDGIVFAIPAHAFGSDNDNVELEINTALSAYDILQHGLSTTSNGALLRTAGMFSINGFANGKKLALTKAINVNVPCDEPDAAMQLFDGVDDGKGGINWVNPKLLTRLLRTYRTESLDFYPPGYIPLLKALGKDYQNKEYTDSLYYSFIGYPFHQESELTNVPTTQATSAVDSVIAKNLRQNDVFAHTQDLSFNYEIDPAKIKAIWNDKFDNTIIATKEFEERLRVIHGLCDGLQIYLQNLDKPLYQIDQMFADRCPAEFKEKFLQFAARKDGGVSIADGMQQKLSNYFQQKNLAYNQAAAKTLAKYQAELSELENMAIDRKQQRAASEIERVRKDFNEELCINLKDAYRQIGQLHECQGVVVPPAARYYTVSITTTGWKNLDAYVAGATEGRQSMTYTDSVTGRTAKIVYAKIDIKIKDAVLYDKILVYLVPDSLSSFIRVQKQGDSYKEQLNSLFAYDAIVLAYKGNQAFFYKKKKVRPDAYVFDPRQINNTELQEQLNIYTAPKATVLRTEFDFQIQEIQETSRQLLLQKDLQFRDQIARVIFKCGRDSAK